MSGAQNVSENVKLAREKALVGSYGDAQVFYEGAVYEIKQLVKQTKDLDMKEKWQQVSNTEIKIAPRLCKTALQWLGSAAVDKAINIEHDVLFCRHWQCSVKNLK